MHRIFSKWIDRYFSDEEAVLLFVLLGAALLVILTLGQMLTPVFAGLIPGVPDAGGRSTGLESRNFSHIWVGFAGFFLLFVGVFLATLLFISTAGVESRRGKSVSMNCPRILSEVQASGAAPTGKIPGYDLGRAGEMT